MMKCHKCINAGKQVEFATYDEYVKHMNWRHRRQTACQKHKESFAIRYDPQRKEEEE